VGHSTYSGKTYCLNETGNACFMTLVEGGQCDGDQYVHRWWRSSDHYSFDHFFPVKQGVLRAGLADSPVAKAL
jgi:hypothetical protein